MRWIPITMAFLSAACSFDYTLVVQEEHQTEYACSFETVDEWSEEILVCARPSTWMEADAICGDFGGELLRLPGSYDAQEEIAEIGFSMIGEYWHVGWLEKYECPAMSKFGGASPRYECDDLIGFMCSF